jgi:WD40 repeat protein
MVEFEISYFIFWFALIITVLSIFVILVNINKLHYDQITGSIYIDTLSLIITPCGTFLIGIEGNSIFKYCLTTNNKFRIAGQWDQWDHKDGSRDESKFYYPNALSFSKDGKTLFVSDTYNHVIRAICVETGVTTTFAGQVGIYDDVDGPKEKACFAFPKTLKLSPDGNTLYVADRAHIRAIDIVSGQVDTIIYRFSNFIEDFTFSPDGKHVYICDWKQILKYNFKTSKSEIVLKGRSFVGCELSKDGQLLIISNNYYGIKFVNISTNACIKTISTPFPPGYLSLSNNNKLYVCDDENKMIQVLDISKYYCTNFKTFLQLQLSKYSFLPRQVIETF